MATKVKPYRAKTLAGAERAVRILRRRVRQMDTLLGQYMRDRQQLAKLAAKGACFDGPMEAWDAEALRDKILRNELWLNPDGTRRRKA